jgi:hypothetical protein
MREVTRIGEEVVRGGGAERKKTTELRGETRSLGGVVRLGAPRLAMTALPVPLMGVRLHKPPEYQQYNGQGGKAGYSVNPEGQGFGAEGPGFLSGFSGRSDSGGIAAGRAAVFEEGLFAGEVAFRATYRRECPAAAGTVFRV